MLIDERTKRLCVDMKIEGHTPREIYRRFREICPQSAMSLDTFKRKLRLWREKMAYDEGLLESANLEYNFTPNASTVQVNSEGKVVQAWIKQRVNEPDAAELISAIAQFPKVGWITPRAGEVTGRLLEIPLFDLHFGISDGEYYKETLRDILSLIESKKWERIEVIVGQDLFHNAALSYPRTEKGTIIDKVDMKKAYTDARDFYFSLLKCCIANGNTCVHFSSGNHSETIEWFFVQVLKAAFEGQCEFDDEIRPRKCIKWHEVFIGYGHCEELKNPKDIRCVFTIEFPMEFAYAKVREIHCGHLHKEFKDGDESGIVVRRLSTKNRIDGWSEKMGYVGAHKRFMLFEYSYDRLTEIHYI